MKSNKWLNMLLVVGTLLSITPKAKAEEKGKSQSLTLDMPYNVNIEKTESCDSFGEVTLKPGAVWKQGDLSVETRWNAYRSGTSDGNMSDWMTTMLYAQANYQNWTLKVGKFGLNAPYAAFLECPLTPTLDNRFVGLGDNVCFSGVHVQEAKTGLGLGFVRPDTEVSLEHLDNVVVSYQKDFGKVGASVYASFDEHGVDRAGATAIYRPTEKTSIVGDWVHKDKQNTYIVGVRQKISDKLGISVVGDVVETNGKTTSPAVAVGCDYKLSDNVSVNVVGKHDFRNNDTTFGVALRLSGLFQHKME